MDPPASVRGFILQATYRIEGGRPVVHLYGRLETGETFLVRDRRAVPRFYVRARDREAARAAGAPRLAESDLVTLAGEPVTSVEIPRPANAPPLRDRLHRAAIPTYEADVRFAVRYLIDRGIRGALEIRGPWQPGHAAGSAAAGVDRVFDEPEVAPAEWLPRLAVLALDIETDPEAERLLSVALHGCGASEVHMHCPEGVSCPAGVSSYATEAELVAGFARRLRELDPDVLTGWNVVEFDLRVLLRVAERYGGLLELGRGPGAVRLSRAWRRGPAAASIPGRVVLDGIQLLRGAFIRMESYGLDAVAREVLGEGKTQTAGDGGREVLRLFEEDREALAAYNLTDARLTLGVLERLQLVELAVERSLLTGLPPDRMGASIAAFDFLYLTELGKRGMVAPTVGAAEEPAGETAGGHVLDSRPGLWENVAVLDFKSLYPSLIRTFGLDPLNLVPEGTAEPGDLIAPSGAAFRREPGILPALLDELFPRREAAARAGDRVTDVAIKILMNSFYGVLATPACRFHSPPVANAITSFGRHLLLWTRNRIEEGGQRVLYGDTDSLFVETGEADPAVARKVARELAAALDRDLAEWVRGRYRVESRLELRFERLYLKLLLPPTRGRCPGGAEALRGPGGGGGRLADGLHRHGGGTARLDRPRPPGAAGAL
jgi:DNA polymerase II